MPRLNQINAVLTSAKPDAEKAITEAYKQVQKEALFSGRTRTYQPLDDNGTKLPPESQKVQHRADDLLKKAVETWDNIWALTYSQDLGNCSAKADVVVDGVTLMAGVPVTTLLYLKKQTNDLVTMITHLPVPDPADTWTKDPNSGLLRGVPTVSQKTAKEPTVIIKFPATTEHPAQTELFTKDVPVGTWTQTALSGAVPADQKEALLLRATKLQVAVKEALEEANTLKVERVTLTPLLDFVFGKK